MTQKELSMKANNKLNDIYYTPQIALDAILKEYDVVLENPPFEFACGTGDFLKGLRKETTNE